MKDQKIKVCLACSVGGHLTQMLQLEKFYKNHDSFLLTEKSQLTEGLTKKMRVHFLAQSQRTNPLFIFIFFMNLLRTLMVVIKERPDLIISTGANAALPMCFIGKMFGSKVIFIESFAKVNSPTLTGRMVYPIADLFIVQWESMLKYYPNAKFGGGIF